MKERCSGDRCSKLAEAFRDPAKPYTDRNYLAYCPGHGGDERAKKEMRILRASSRKRKIANDDHAAFVEAYRGVTPL
jgi:hypothetical protein